MKGLQVRALIAPGQTTSHGPEDLQLFIALHRPIAPEDPDYPVCRLARSRKQAKFSKLLEELRS